MALDTDVLIVGAGPAGLLTALSLSRNGIHCLVVERNHDSTQWPKMDLANCRSMELLRRLGIAEEWRSIGVPGQHSLDVLFSTGLAEGGEAFAKWKLPSPDLWRERIRSQNDGTQPTEPWQRGSQSLFESYLRRILEADPLVDIRYGVKFERLEETTADVKSHLVGEAQAASVITSRYVLGCDGGGSRVRRSIGVESIGGPVPGAMYLIHFKSRDLKVLHAQGRFWHIFFTHGAVLISQDEDNTWTLHTPVSLDATVDQFDPHNTIARTLAGSMEGTVPIEVDKIIISSIWRPNVYLSAKYRSEGGRVFLVGDSAHQTIPTGGYGMNTAVGDSYDIGWKLAAVLKGYAGPDLLVSYEKERYPVAEHNLQTAKKHWGNYANWQQQIREAGQHMIGQPSEDGQRARELIKSFIETHDAENQELGTELDYRCAHSPVISAESEATKPQWDAMRYTPSTWPGMRVPNMRLKDGETPIHHLLGSGPEFTIVDFTPDGKFQSVFAAEAQKLQIPLRQLHLANEKDTRRVWERDAVLVRPDDFVVWRAGLENGKSSVGQVARAALLTAVGRVDEVSS